MRSGIRLCLICDRPQPYVDMFTDCSMITLVQSDGLDLILTDYPPERFADIPLFGQYPLISVGSVDNAASAMRALRAGASYYLAHPTCEQMLVAIEQVMATLPIQRLDKVAQAAPIMLHLINREGILLDVNAHCLHELGYRRDDLIGKPFTWLIASASSSAEILPQLWRFGSLLNQPQQYRRHQGAALDVLINASVLLGEERAVVTAYNITNQRAIEAAERDQRLLVEALHATTTTLTATLDFDEVLDRILSSVAQVVPYDTASIMLIEDDAARIVRNQSATDLGREISVPRALFKIEDTPTLRLMLTTGRPLAIANTAAYVPWVHLPQSDWIKSFVGVPIMADGEVIGFLTLNSGKYSTYNQHHAERLLSFANQASSAIRNARHYETIQRHATELERRVVARTAELNRERQKLQTILEATGEGIVYIADDHIQYANQAIQNITGYQSDELIGHALSAFDIKGRFAEKWAAMRAQVMAGAIFRDEIRMLRKDGVKIDAGLTVSLFGDGSDGRQRIVVVVRDISQEKALQDQQSRFIAMASHELRTPIANLRTRLYLVKRDPYRMSEHLDVINLVTIRMQQLIEDMLDQSRFDGGMIPLNYAEVELQQLVGDVIRVQSAEAEARNIRLRINLTDKPQCVWADAGRLTQVITNLVTNSLSYTEPGGLIEVGLKTDGQQAIITVRDTGMGIAPEYLNTIFKPFVRGNDKVNGTGLGLSIAREIVELHHGKIWVESKLDQGSCFFISLQLLDNRKRS